MRRCRPDPEQRDRPAAEVLIEGYGREREDRARRSLTPDMKRGAAVQPKRPD